MNEILRDMTVTLVEPAILALVGPWLGWCLSGEAHPGLLEFRISAFRKNMLL